VLVTYKPELGVPKGQPMTLRNALNAVSVSFSVLKDVSGKIKKDIMKLTCITVRDAVFVLMSAGQKQ
jgi:hypothetical protein